MAFDERDLFNEKPETRTGRLPAPSAGGPATTRSDGSAARRRTGLPPGADEVDREKFAKLRDYLLRLDDEVTCKACGKRFEIPSQHSLMFVDQLAGLPNADELEREIRGASGEPEPEPRASPRCPRGSRASRAGGSRRHGQPD